MTRFVLILAFLCAACAPPGPVTQPEGHVRIEGRAVFSEDGTLTVHWPGSGANFRFSGEALEAVIEAETGDSWLNVALGEETRPLKLRQGRHAYTFTGHSNGEPPEVRLVRRTGPQTGAVTFHGFRGGGLEPIEPPERRILILGDSITVGYGVLGPDETCAYSPETEDHEATYAASLRRAFGAEVHAIAISGRGLVRNWDGGEGAHMREVWAWLTPEGGVWDAGRFQPDAILIALGTNDFSTADPGDAFTEEYTSLLRNLADGYPGAALYAVTGPLLPPDIRTRLETAVDQAVASFAAGGGTASRISLPLAEDGHVYGCDWHPGRDTQALMARILIDSLSADLDWTAQDF